MQNPTPHPPPRPALPRRLLDDAWWLAAALADRPARVIPFPGPPPATRPGGGPR